MAKVSANQIQPVYSHWEGLTDEQFMMSMTDFEEYCRNSIIYDKNGHPVTFELNEAQKLTADTILKAIEPILTKKPTPSIRVCIHKSRQMGITTLCLKLEQYIMSKVTHFNTIHIMPTEPEADELRDRKLMPMLQATHPDLMPVMISSGNHIDFKEFEGNLLDNRLTYGSAGAKGGYHGRTIHCLVEDEHSKYIDPFTLEAGLLPAMSGNTIRIVLFTAKGMNHSYDLSKTAQDPESDWVYLFLPWYLLSEYEMTPVGKYESLRGLSDYDIFLFEEFKRAGVPKNKWQAKAMWYNYTFINEAKRDTKYMYENYPTIAEESFKASGSPIFDANKIREWEKQPHKKLDVFYREGKTVFEYTDDGVIREKEPPRRGQTYIIGADPADGEVAGDDSALVVFKLTDDKISAVCSYNGSISQNDFAELLYDVAMRYNEALIVPERNTGQLMIKWLTEIKGYFNIWTDVSKVSNYNNLGVYTTVATKNEAIGRIKFLINNGHYEDFDPRFCEQAKYFTYERTPSGQLRAAAAGGHHDDTVMCRVIAMMALDMERFGNYNEMAIKDGRKY